MARPSNQLVFTHPACMPSRVLADTGESLRDMDVIGLAFVLADKSGRSHAYLAFEVAAHLWEVPADAPEPIDVLVSHYLGAGFALVIDALAEHSFPVTPGWHMKIADQQITLWDELGRTIYSASRGEVPDAWLRQVNEDGACRVLTGSGTGLLTDTFREDIDAAIAAGRVVGSTIRTTVADVASSEARTASHDVPSMEGRSKVKETARQMRS